MCDEALGGYECVFFFQAEDGIRDYKVTGVQTCALPISDFTVVNRGGNVQALANVLFNSYFFPFEVTSILLIVAAIGAMLHGRRRVAEEETIDAPVDVPVEEPVP